MVQSETKFFKIGLVVLIFVKSNLLKFQLLSCFSKTKSLFIPFRYAQLLVVETMKAINKKLILIL